MSSRTSCQYQYQYIVFKAIGICSSILVGTVESGLEAIIVGKVELSLVVAHWIPIISSFFQVPTFLTAIFLQMAWLGLFFVYNFIDLPPDTVHDHKR